MPKNRRGFPPGAASDATLFVMAANAGVIASSSGRERRMPAPRRNFLRDKAGRVETKGPVAVRVTGVFIRE